MTSLTHTISSLSEKATQGEWSFSIDAVTYSADKELAIALVNAWRSGWLHISDELDAATVERCAQVAEQWKHHDPISGNVVWREQQFWNGHRSTEQRALYTSPRLDRERLAAIFESADEQDWSYLFSVIPDGGRGRFWKDRLTALRNAIMRETR